MKVSILGAAGGIGQALSLLLKTQLPNGADLSLYDIAPVTPGVAADLSHIPTDVKVIGDDGKSYSIDKMRFPKKDQKDIINYNRLFSFSNNSLSFRSIKYSSPV